jgi:hypothetical protein
MYGEYTLSNILGKFDNSYFKASELGIALSNVCHPFGFLFVNPNFNLFWRLNHKLLLEAVPYKSKNFIQSTKPIPV